MPPELIGRDYIIDEFEEGIENGCGAPERLMRLTGGRGMGKTVMLNELGRLCKNKGWTVISETANQGFTTRILDSLSSKSHISHAELKPTALGLSLGGIEIERASSSLRDAIGKTCRKNHGLLITLDEVQDATMEEIRALAVAVQHSISEDLNIAFVFAGIPSMIDNVVNGKTLTFLRRALPERLEPLGTHEIAISYKDIFKQGNMIAQEDVIEKMARASQGYPFMVQLVGYYSWKAASKHGKSHITPENADEGIRVARDRFDEMVIEPALQSLAPSYLDYLNAMAQSGDDLVKTIDIAKRLGKTQTGLSSCRDRLIRESVIESPSRGNVAFTIPYMAEYLNRKADA